MIAVPEAALLPSVPRPMRALELVDQLARESRSGNVGNGRSSTSPINSQCPVTESLPGDASAMRPKRADRALPCGVAGDRRATRARPEAAQRRHAQTDLPRDVAERVAALVAVGGGIRQFADADAVENDQEDAVG